MKKFVVDFLEDYSKDSIATELKRVAHHLGKRTLSKREIEIHAKLSYSVILKRFGSLRKALEYSDLTPQRFMKATESELISIILDLWEKTLEQEGRKPFKSDLKKYNYPVSGDTIIRKFGTWKKALIKASESVEIDTIEEEPEIVSKDKKKSSRSLSLRKRFFILKRDGFSCKLCGASGPGVRLEVDHIVPVDARGPDALDNLQTLCFECNRGKRTDLI